MRKRVVQAISLALCMGVILSVSGCGSSSDAEIQNLNKIKAADETESSVTSLTISNSDMEKSIYEQVSDRQLIDLMQLDEVPDDAIPNVTSYMDSVNTQIRGELQEDISDLPLDESFSNYLLFEMEKTPYAWARSKMIIRGLDPTSQSVIVDVTYKTTGVEKPTKATSPIPRGIENYDLYCRNRLVKWNEYLNAIVNNRTDKADSLHEEFVKAYGDPDEIMEAQDELSLQEQANKYKVTYAYPCVADSKQEKGSATMVVRFVLSPNYAMGINRGYTCTHMYLTSYKLDKDPTTATKKNKKGEKVKLYKAYTKEGADVISDYVSDILYRYYVCLDENNHSGLNKLVKDYGKYDTYLDNYFKCTYHKNAGFTVTLFNVSDSKIICGVTLSRKVRGKGSDMSLPTYTDRYLYSLELVDNQLKITNEVLLSSKLVGEPKIQTEEADTSGFSSTMNLNGADKQKVEQVISDFSTLQVLGDVSSDAFSDVVDNSISSSSLNDIKTAMTTVTDATKKVTFLSSWESGYSNYATVNLREVFQKSDNSLVELNSSLSCIYRGDKWMVYKYSIRSVNNLDTTTLATKSALCVNDANGLVGKINSTVTSDGEITEEENEEETFGKAITYPVDNPNVDTKQLKMDKVSNKEDVEELQESYNK